MDIGDVYLVTDRRIDDHAKVVISDPSLNPNQVVWVNFTGAEGEYRDHSCILEIGDHPWIMKRTCISYKDAMFVKEADIDSLVAKGKIRKLDEVSDAVLRKIHEGAEITDELPGKYQRVLVEQNLIS